MMPLGQRALQNLSGKRDGSRHLRRLPHWMPPVFPISRLASRDGSVSNLRAGGRKAVGPAFPTALEPLGISGNTPRRDQQRITHLDYATLVHRVECEHLQILGAFHPELGEGLGQTLVLLGPFEPHFWGQFKASAEYCDGQADPMDRWSARVIGALAQEMGAVAFFPFGPPPYMPFLRWAERSGRAWQSPAGPLVHDRSGMMVSYRGALALPWMLNVPPTGQSPCVACDSQPCLSACPVSALSAASGYNVAACHSWLQTTHECLGNGCLARRACPVSQEFPRLAEQSAFHMAAFHP